MQAAHFIPALLLNFVTQNPAVTFHDFLKVRREMTILELHKMLLLRAHCIFECSETSLLTKCWRTECNILLIAVHLLHSLASFHTRGTTPLEHTVPSHGQVPKGKHLRELLYIYSYILIQLLHGKEKQ